MQHTKPHRRIKRVSASELEFHLSQTQFDVLLGLGTFVVCYAAILLVYALKFVWHII